MFVRMNQIVRPTVRQHGIARRDEEQLDELRSRQRQATEPSRQQRGEHHGLLSGLAEMEDEPNIATEDVGPTVSARRRESEAADALEHWQVG